MPFDDLSRFLRSPQESVGRSTLEARAAKSKRSRIKGRFQRGLRQRKMLGEKSGKSGSMREVARKTKGYSELDTLRPGKSNPFYRKAVKKAGERTRRDTIKRLRGQGTARGRMRADAMERDN